MVVLFLWRRHFKLNLALFRRSMRLSRTSWRLSSGCPRASPPCRLCPGCHCPPPSASFNTSAPPMKPSSSSSGGQACNCSAICLCVNLYMFQTQRSDGVSVSWSLRSWVCSQWTLVRPQAAWLLHFYFFFLLCKVPFQSAVFDAPSSHVDCMICLIFSVVHFVMKWLLQFGIKAGFRYRNSHFCDSL